LNPYEETGWKKRQPFAQAAQGKQAAALQRSGEVEFDFVDVAPAPGFARFDRTHDGMLGAVKMFGGVLVLRRITAANVATFHAKAKVNPGVTHFQTLLAAGSVRGDFMNVGEMRAGRRHDFAPLSRVCPSKRSEA
jgi:hypothetical protein